MASWLRSGLAGTRHAAVRPSVYSVGVQGVRVAPLDGVGRRQIGWDGEMGVVGGSQWLDRSWVGNWDFGECGMDMVMVS